MIDPIRKTVTVPLSPDAAFDLFTNGIDAWWPKASHSISAMSGSVARALSVEPRVGGAVTEIQSDGAPTIWGSVTKWEPGHVFAMTWHVGRDASEASSVTVTFEPVDAGSRVTLIHDGWAALGERASEARASYAGGWDNVFLNCYAGACRARAEAA